MLLRRALIPPALSPLATQGVIAQPPTERPAANGGAVTQRTPDGRFATQIPSMISDEKRTTESSRSLRYFIEGTNPEGMAADKSGGSVQKWVKKQRSRDRD